MISKLALTSQVLYDKEILELQKLVIELKSAYSEEAYLSRLGYMLREVNDLIIRCGCDNCVGYSTHCYPLRNDNIRDGDDDDDGVEWGPSDNTIELKRIKTEDCIMWKWFNDKCQEYKCPTPTHPKDCSPPVSIIDCNIDYESKYYYRTCDKDFWYQKIFLMSYAEQCKTLYPMLYSIHLLVNEPQDRIPTFDGWFSTNRISLKIE